jgi:hypothetical protein
MVILDCIHTLVVEDRCPLLLQSLLGRHLQHLFLPI